MPARLEITREGQRTLIDKVEDLQPKDVVSFEENNFGKMEYMGRVPSGKSGHLLIFTGRVSEDKVRKIQFSPDKLYINEYSQLSILHDENFREDQYKKEHPQHPNYTNIDKSLAKAGL